MATPSDDAGHPDAASLGSPRPNSRWRPAPLATPDGRGKGGCLPGDPKLSCRYTITTAALCANRMARLRAMGGPAWAKLPSQVMEYGLQQNSLNIVSGWRSAVCWTKPAPGYTVACRAVRGATNGNCTANS